MSSTNCFGCGRSLESIRDQPLHAPEPKSEEDRCASRPRKYSDLRCMYATGHQCKHSTRMPGTGRHYWSDADQAVAKGDRGR